MVLAKRYSSSFLNTRQEASSHPHSATPTTRLVLCFFTSTYPFDNLFLDLHLIGTKYYQVSPFPDVYAKSESDQNSHFTKSITMGNITSNYKSAKAKKSSERFSQYLKPLSPEEIYSTVIKHLEDDPTKRAKFMLLNDTTIVKPIIMTQQDMDLVVNDCYRQIWWDTVDFAYIDAVVEGIVQQVERGEGSPKESMIWALEKILDLTARMVKGEGCTECREKCREPTRFDSFSRANILQAVDDLGMEAIDEGAELSGLNERTKFCLDKLRSTHFVYEFIHGLSQADSLKNEPTYKHLAEMWCESDTKVEKHDPAWECTCWDEDFTYHSKLCPMAEEYLYKDIF